MWDMYYVCYYVCYLFLVQSQAHNRQAEQVNNEYINI